MTSHFAFSWQLWGYRSVLSAGMVISILSFQNLGHSEEAVVGSLSIVQTDDFKGNRFQYHYYVKESATNTTYEIHPKSRLGSSLSTDDKVKVQGSVVGKHVYDASVLYYSGSNSGGSSGTGSTPPPLMQPGALGVQNTLVMLVNFIDNPITPWTVDQVNTEFFVNLNQYILDSSYQQTSLKGQVVGYYTLPVTSASLASNGTCNTATIAQYADQAATSAGINLASYNRHVYKYPYLSSCAFAGASSVGGNPSQAWINGGGDDATNAHELGHSLGLFHSHALDCGTSTIIGTVGSGCVSWEYGDPTDTMGESQIAAPEFNAFQKEKLGWLNYGGSPPITSVTQNGTYSIQPYEGGAGAKALKIYQSTNSTTGLNTYFYVEARLGLGYWDSFLLSTGIPTTCPYHSSNLGCYLAVNSSLTQGVIIHLGTPGKDASYLLDMTPATPTHNSWYDYDLAVGQTFTDPASGVTITNLSTGASGATLSVSGAKAPPSTSGGGKHH